MNTAFESIKQGLTEAAEFAEGRKGKAMVHEFSPLDVKAIRKKVGMSQTEFASAFGISLGTLKHPLRESSFANVTAFAESSGDHSRRLFWPEILLDLY
ncbi:MAG: hypothetical protein U9N60_06505 [Thermodesulfobacteriota bacterium]|nr:hypothetical protein [Thermodesulfobacteriota bacterium]